MIKENIKKKYQLKLKEINKHNKLYYNKSKPIISDSSYDELKNELLALEKKYPYLIKINSPSKIVGYKKSKIFQKFEHKVPMLSLSNAFDEDDLINFEKNFNYLNKKKNLNIVLSRRLMVFLLH